MRQIWIVLRSEFVRRVRSKWFIITTLIGPLILIAMAVLPAAIGIFAAGSSERTIAVVDDTGVLMPNLLQFADDAHRFVTPDVTGDSLRLAVQAGRYDGYLHLPAEVLEGAGSATYFSGGGGGLSLSSRLGRVVDRAVESERLVRQQAPPEVLEIVRSSVPMRMVTLTDEGEKADATVIYSAVGYIMGFIIYIAMFIYGAYVLHAVIEEKQSRVVEVMVSSVKPFDLLMGKVLGIGAMGLFQMAVWGLLLMAITAFAGSIAALFLDPASLNLPADASQEAVLQAADFAVPEVPFSVFFWFIVFFLGGYLLYASLFAAIGSAVEQQQDAQGLMAPLTMLIIVPILFIALIIESPGSTLSVVLSLVPFFSPILMVVRVAVSDVPLWQLAASISLLIGGFIGAIWLSSRIYRVGILMYGKKASLRDLARWIRYA